MSRRCAQRERERGAEHDNQTGAPQFAAILLPAMARSGKALTGLNRARIALLHIYVM